MNIKYDTENGLREVMLTFNDGPHSVLTPKLLDILKSENIKAMFFVLGINAAADKNIKIVKRAYEEGHIIGNHTYFHRNLKKLSENEIRAEILYTEKLIKSFLTVPKLFRPPFGATNVSVNQILWEFGYENVPSSVDSLDWKDMNGRWVEHTLNQINAREDSVVLMHDTYESTINHLPELILPIKNYILNDFVIS
ncbi:MAG: polysaccharide deacetylase family protein [Ignavibacteriaceae bacterium]|nr:polysaccharide deacetylase family protein [Ignavibacteriaceae bacterium]